MADINTTSAVVDGDSQGHPTTRTSRSSSTASESSSSDDSSNSSTLAESTERSSWDIFYIPFDRLIEQAHIREMFEERKVQLRRQRETMKKGFEDFQARLEKSGPSQLNLFKEGKAKVELDKYRRSLNDGIHRMSRRWNDPDTVTTREKMAFISGVLNVFISGLLFGSRPEWFFYWYAVQLACLMPNRFYNYKQKGYHYFLADLCYFVNFLLVLSIFVFPANEALFLSAFCLAFGNNAVAIAMWRNSLVFHSIDKVTSLFIHIMPCATIHTLVHLIPQTLRQSRFPAVDAITTSHPSLTRMILCASIPYAVWQLTYHIFITVGRRAKIEAGRPTSFTYLSETYAKTSVGRLIRALPKNLQPVGFMGLQYGYAVLTMLPCPFWLSYPIASGAYLFSLFVWSVYNGSTFYLDVFGQRFKKELKQLREELDLAHLESQKSETDGGAESTEKVVMNMAPATVDTAFTSSVTPSST